MGKIIDTNKQRKQFYSCTIIGIKIGSCIILHFKLCNGGRKNFRSRDKNTRDQFGPEVKILANRTRCQISGSMRFQCVTKILTPRRMLKKSSLIAKINCWNNNFQNMYDMLQVKVDRFARKTFFPSKKTPKNRLFLRTRFRRTYY